MTSDDITEAFNHNLIDSGPIAARRAAAKEIARMDEVGKRIAGNRANLRLIRGRLLSLAGELNNPIELLHAAAQVQLAMAQLDEWRAMLDV